MRERTDPKSLRKALVAIALLGVLALALPSTAAARHRRAYNTFFALNAPIPDRSSVPKAPDGRLSVPIGVGKKFKHRRVGNVNVTFQTSSPSPNATGDLQFYLTAPSGRMIRLLPNIGGFGGSSIGPLTLSANSNVGLCNSAKPPCANPFETLNRPFVGTAGDSGLALMRGQRMRGSWTFTVLDTVHGEMSTLNALGLNIRPA